MLARHGKKGKKQKEGRKVERRLWNQEQSQKCTKGIALLQYADKTKCGVVDLFTLLGTPRTTILATEPDSRQARRSGNLSCKSQGRM